MLGMRDGCMLAEVKNRFHVGDMIEALTPAGAKPFTVTEIRSAADGTRLDFVSVAGQQVLLPVDFIAEDGDYLRGPNRNHRMAQ